MAMATVTTMVMMVQRDVGGDNNALEANSGGIKSAEATMTTTTTTSTLHLLMVATYRHTHTQEAVANNTKQPDRERMCRPRGKCFPFVGRKEGAKYRKRALHYCPML